MAKKNLMICKNSSSSLRLNESVGDGRYILEGIFAGPLDGTKNRNGRIYTAEEYLKHISYLRDDIKSGELMGCLDHPDIFEVKLKEASHRVLDIWYDDKTKCVMGKIQLLETPNGKIAKELVDAGVPLHISSRASGSVNPDGTVKIQQIFTYDLVCKSGFKDAILHRVTESADVNKYSKDVMDYLTESEKVERKNIAKQYGFINEDVSIQEMAVAPKLRKEAKAIQENEKNYNMTNNIHEDYKSSLASNFLNKNKNENIDDNAIYSLAQGAYSAVSNVAKNYIYVNKNRAFSRVTSRDIMNSDYLFSSFEKDVPVSICLKNFISDNYDVFKRFNVSSFNSFLDYYFNFFENEVKEQRCSSFYYTIMDVSYMILRDSLVYWMSLNGGNKTENDTIEYRDVDGNVHNDDTINQAKERAEKKRKELYQRDLQILADRMIKNNGQISWKDTQDLYLPVIDEEELKRIINSKKGITESLKEYMTSAKSNINENSIDVQRVIDDSNFVLSVEISSNPEKIANLINTTSMKNPNVTVLCTDGTVWFCFDNETDFIVPEDVEMERVKGFETESVNEDDDNDDKSEKENGDDKDDKGVEILDVQVEGGDDEDSDDEDKKEDDEDESDDNDKNENVNEDDEDDDSDDKDDKDDKGVEILDVKVEGDEDDDEEDDEKKNDESDDNEDDTDEGCCKKKHKKDISEKDKKPDPEKDMIIDCKDIQARKEKFEDKFADLVDTIKSKSEKKKTNESNIINKYPISAMMNESNFGEFKKLDESQKSKVVEYLNDNRMISIDLVNENWKSGINYERDTEIWLKYAPQNYKELYESAPEATKKSISNMAAYVIFENISDVRRFWEGTGLKTQSERLMLNENFVNNMPKISKPVEDINLPYSKDFINMVTEMACGYNNPY